MDSNNNQGKKQYQQNPQLSGGKPPFSINSSQKKGKILEQKFDTYPLQSDGKYQTQANQQSSLRSKFNFGIQQQDNVFQVTPLTPVSINNRKKGYVSSFVGGENEAQQMSKKHAAGSVNTEKHQSMNQTATSNSQMYHHNKYKSIEEYKNSIYQNIDQIGQANNTNYFNPTRNQIYQINQSTNGPNNNFNNIYLQQSNDQGEMFNLVNRQQNKNLSAYQNTNLKNLSFSQSSSRLIQNDMNAESLGLMNAYVASEFSSSVLNSTQRGGSSKQKYHNILQTGSSTNTNPTSFLPKITDKNQILPTNLYSTQLAQMLQQSNYKSQWNNEKTYNQMTNQQFQMNIDAQKMIKQTVASLNNKIDERGFSSSNNRQLIIDQKQQMSNFQKNLGDKQKQQDLSMLLIKQELVAEQFIENAKIQNNKQKSSAGNSKSVRVDKHIKDEPIQTIYLNNLNQLNDSRLINPGNNQLMQQQLIQQQQQSKGAPRHAKSNSHCIDSAVQQTVNQNSKQQYSINNANHQQNNTQYQINQNFRVDMNETQTKDKKDKQLEDLNETLQRLAREKYIKNIPGAGGMLSNSRKKNQKIMTMMNQTQQNEHNVISIGGNNAIGQNQYIEPQSGSKVNDDGNNQKKDKKKKQKQKFGLAHEAFQQKLESQQRSALIMGDPLVNQRLQGVKQGQTQQLVNQQSHINKATAELKKQIQLEQQLASSKQSAQKAKEQVHDITNRIESYLAANQKINILQTPPQTVSNKMNQNNLKELQQSHYSQSNSPSRYQNGEQDKNDNYQQFQQIQRIGSMKISTNEPIILKNKSITKAKMIGDKTQDFQIGLQKMNLNEADSESDINNDYNKQKIAQGHYQTQGGFNPSQNDMNPLYQLFIQTNFEKMQKTPQPIIHSQNFYIDNKYHVQENQKMKFNINKQPFSSVIEDVELEQQNSPLLHSLNAFDNKNKFQKVNGTTISSSQLSHSDSIKPQAQNAYQPSLLTQYGGVGFQHNKTTISNNQIKSLNSNSVVNKKHQVQQDNFREDRENTPDIQQTGNQKIKKSSKIKQIQIFENYQQQQLYHFLEYQNSLQNNQLNNSEILEQFQQVQQNIPSQLILQNIQLKSRNENSNQNYGIPGDDKKYDGQSKTPIVNNNKEDLSKLAILNNQFLKEGANQNINEQTLNQKQEQNAAKQRMIINQKINEYQQRDPFYPNSQKIQVGKYYSSDLDSIIFDQTQKRKDEDDSAQNNEDEEIAKNSINISSARMIYAQRDSENQDMYGAEEEASIEIKVNRLKNQQKHKITNQNLINASNRTFSNDSGIYEEQKFKRNDNIKLMDQVSPNGRQKKPQIVDALESIRSSQQYQKSKNQFLAVKDNQMIEMKIMQRTQTQQINIENEEHIRVSQNLESDIIYQEDQCDNQMLDLPPQLTDQQMIKYQTPKNQQFNEKNKQSVQGSKNQTQGKRNDKINQAATNSFQAQNQQLSKNGNMGKTQIVGNSAAQKTFSNSPTKKDSKQQPQKFQNNQKVQLPIKNQSITTNKAQELPENDDGYISSDAPAGVINLKVGHKILRENYSFCMEYIQYKGSNKLHKDCRHLFTKRRYRKGDSLFSWSTRMFMSKECAFSEDRRRMPILVVNLDGAVGFWDDLKRNYYVLRPKIVEGLIQLSYDFRIVAVSSQRQKLIRKVIYGLMNIFPGSDCPNGVQGDASTQSQLKHLVFDGVYQLNSQNQDAKNGNFIKNIDEVHFDLTQILADMQFKKHRQKKEKLNEKDHLNCEDKNNFKTFWEVDSYRPYKKLIIFSTDKYLMKSNCYSFDYNYLYQATNYKHEESKKAPIVIQMPHLRLFPKLSFQYALQLLFTIQNVALAISCRYQAQQKYIEDKIFENPEFSSFEICKKFLCSKWKNLQNKIRKTSNVKGLRVFDSSEDPFVDLELLDFSETYSFLKKYFEDRKSDWLKIKKYYLFCKPEEKENLSPMKIKQNLKVTFEESPDIRRIGEERDKASSSLRAAATTHDSSKSDKFSIMNSQFISEDAKNLYNGLLIRNYKIQQEINAYARHFRIQNQRKVELKKQQDKDAQLQEEQNSPIVIYDGDKENNEPKLKSSMKQYPTISQQLKNDKQKEDEAKKQKKKKYAFKYRVLQIKTGEPIEDLGEIDLKQHQLINMRINPVAQNFVKLPHNSQAISQINEDQLHSQNQHQSNQINQDYLNHTFSQIVADTDKKNQLIELLSKRQVKINYFTNQEMHLKNNLNQLVDGEQQYKDQQQQLVDIEKEQQANQPQLNDKDKQQPLNYIDLI